jgi:hypothetical protein
MGIPNQEECFSTYYEMEKKKFIMKNDILGSWEINNPLNL